LPVSMMMGCLRLKDAGELAGRLVEQADELARGCAEHAEELREQDVARGKIGDGLNLFAADDETIHDARADGWLLEFRREVLENLRGSGDVLFTGDDRILAAEFAEVGQTSSLHREAQIAVLDDLAARASLVEAGAQLGELDDIEAGVIGDEKERRIIEPLVEVCDDGCFCWVHGVGPRFRRASGIVRRPR
jgi:hypothetical protein